MKSTHAPLGLRSRRVLRAWLALALLSSAAACHDKGGGGSGDAGSGGKASGGAGGHGGSSAAANNAPPPGRTPLTLDEARDPQQCKKCHPVQFREWQSSMHAYAAKDPVFLAMNKRGQRETNGALGEFCVKCHAPLAVLTGQTTDGLNLDQLDDSVKGVTCYFCHNATAVDGTHNAMVTLANDVTMRGPLSDARNPGVHSVAYSAMFNGDKPESAAFCGGCHDIVTPGGVHLERTFDEYSKSIVSQLSNPLGFLTCAKCHMTGTSNTTIADDPGSRVPANRTRHEHMWPGVDVPLTDNPSREAITSAVRDCQLNASIPYMNVSADEVGTFTFVIESQAGHSQPSGAAQDRRMWLEVKAYDDSGKVFFSSGDIADDEVEEKPADDPKHDKSLWMFRDRLFDGDGNPTHMFWQAATSSAHPNGYESNLLPYAKTAMAGGHSATKKYLNILVPSTSGSAPLLPARLTARLRMRPMGLDVLQDLVDSGDLDASVLAQMPTFTLGDATLEWKRSDGMKTVFASSNTPDCQRYQCLLDEMAPGCSANP